MTNEERTQMSQISVVPPIDTSFGNYSINDDIYYQNIDNKDNRHNWFFKNKFLNLIYFNIRNNHYEINIMWCLIIVTIIILISLVIKDAHDELEAQRVT